MSALGITLKDLVGRNKINIYQIAKKADIDRSTIHKIITAGRLPSYEFMEKMIGAMPLTPDEKMILWQAYERQKVGEYRYNQRNQVKQIFEVMDSLADMMQAPYITPPCPETLMTKDIEIVQGELAVKQLLEIIINYEVSTTEDRNISFYMPYHDSFFFQVLFLRYASEKQLKASCIFKFGKNMEESEKYNKNLEILQALMPFLLFPDDRFEAYYIYKNASCEETSLAAMPYYIVTSEIVVTLTADMKTAVFYRVPDLVDCYKGIFEKALQGATPLLKRVNSIEHMAIHYSSILTGKESDVRVHAMEAQPCLANYFDKALIEAHVTREGVRMGYASGREEFITMVTAYYEMISMYLGAGVIPFTENGLDELIRTGRLLYLPEQFVTSFTKAERKMFVERMITDTENDELCFRIVDTSKCKVPRYVFVDVYEGIAVNMSAYYLQDPGKINIVFIQEESIVNAFDDFMDGMKDSELLYSKEQTLHILKNSLLKLNQSDETSENGGI